MRCTNCDLPLSPARTTANCPRCGAPVYTGQKAQASPGANHNMDGAPARMGAPASNGFRGEAPFHSAPPSFGSQAGQMWMPGPGPARPGDPGSQYSPAGFQSPRRSQPYKSNNAKLGFMVAGLCILLGGLILIFVYFMATSQAGQTDHAGSGSNGTPQTSAPTSTPQATMSPTSAPSPTAATLPGKQFVDNAQLASAIDQKSYRPVQVTTTFKVGQTIYVTFDLHPSGQSGVVCVNWYLSNQQVTQYKFTDAGGTFSSYSSAIYGSSGPAYVEIYWAGSQQCTGGLLAQHVDFTVTA
jgi:hypothetical protein